MQNLENPTAYLRAEGAHDVGLLMAIDGLLRSSDRGRLQGLSVVDPANGVPIHAGEYWVRASVDRNILVALGRSPDAITRLDYLRQGSSFNALCATAIFAVEVAAEKHRVRLRNGIDVVAAMAERQEVEHVH